MDFKSSTIISYEGLICYLSIFTLLEPRYVGKSQDILMYLTAYECDMCAYCALSTISACWLPLFLVSGHSDPSDGSEESLQAKDRSERERLHRKHRDENSGELGRGYATQGNLDMLNL